MANLPNLADMLIDFMETFNMFTTKFGYNSDCKNKFKTINGAMKISIYSINTHFRINIRQLQNFQKPRLL